MKFYGKRELANKKPPLKDLVEDEKRQMFEIRANAILAFVDCDADKRAKLRAAIVDAMLWAQTQP